MKPPSLSIAELEGLRAFRDRLIRKWGDKPSGEEDDPEVLEIRQAGIGAPFTARVFHGEAIHSQSISRISPNAWRGQCNCADRGDCPHCLEVVKQLLSLYEDATGSKPKAKSLAELAESALGRPLKPAERRYASEIQEDFQRVRTTRAVFGSDLVAVAAGELKRDMFDDYRQLSGEDLWPAFPENALQYWQALARVVLRRGGKIPTFLREASLAMPPPESWQVAWREQELREWRDFFQSVAKPQAELARKPAQARHPLHELRLVVGNEPPMLEVRPAGDDGAEWTTLSQARLIEWIRGKGDIPPLTAPSDLLLEKLRDGVQSQGTGMRHALESLAGLAFAGDVATRPTLRPLLVDADRHPLVFHEQPVRWHLEPVPDKTEYSLELRLPDGAPMSGDVIALEGRSGHDDWIIRGRDWYPAPPRINDRSFDQVLRVPRDAAESPEGLRGLALLGVQLPPELDQRIRRVPLRLNLEFGLASLPGERGGETVTVNPTLVDPQGRTVFRRSKDGWKPVGTPPTSPAGVHVIHEHPPLPEPSELVRGIGVKPEGAASRLSGRITKSFPGRFEAWARSLPEAVELDLPPLLESILAQPVETAIRLHMEETAVDWFDLSLEISAEESTLTPEELRLLIGAKGDHVRLGDRGWFRARVSLSEEDQRHLAGIGLDTDDLTGTPQRFHILHLAGEGTRRLLPPERAQLVQQRAEEFKTRVTPDVPAAIRATLRPYQVEGFHFLAYLAENRFGGVLADDMGLGKTLQTLTWIAWLREQAEVAPAAAAPRLILVVCPKSVAPNWNAEAARFLPELRVLVWSGKPESGLAETLGRIDALIVNYAQLRTLETTLVSQEWLAVILDEAQAIKNPDSQTAQVARTLRARHRIALTGTPIENRLLDLWSILSFAMPGALGSRSAFQRSFGRPGDSLARQRLAARVRPFLLRRTKSQVAQDLPPRIEEDVVCELEGVQRDLYRAEYKKARAMLLGVKSSAEFRQLQFHFLTSLLRLRQICCHPALVDPQRRPAASAKLEALFDLLEPLLAEGHKVLVFSQFATMLGLLQEEVRHRGWKDFLLTGQTEDRGPLVDAFNASPDPAVFLISLKAGGFGLNLTSASYVVLFDPWWNPAVEAQAIDRTHRIGQTQTVIAYRLIVKGSIEQKMRQLQKAKSALAQDILGEERFNQALTLDDFRFLFDSADAGL